MAGVANKLSGGKYGIIDVGIVTVEAGQHCFMATETVTACPVIHVTDPEGATENVGDESCAYFDNLIEVVALYNDCLENNNQAACDALNQIVDEDDDDSGGLSTGAWIGIGVGGGVLVLAGIALILSSSRASNSPRTRNTNTARGKGVREVDYAFEHGDEDMTISTDNE